MNKIDFPLLNNKPTFVYFDNASTTQKPQTVIEEMTSFYVKQNANVHRGVYRLAEEATEILENSRACVANFLNVNQNEIIFNSGTTDGLNMLAATLPIEAGDEVIVTEMEHHANFLPWQERCKREGAKLKIVPMLDDGQLDLTTLSDLLNERTKVVAVTHVSNVLGIINPIRKIADLVHQQKAILVVDGAQAVGHLPIDLQDLNCDAYTFSAHKMYGPMGFGVLWVKANLARKLSLWKTGGGIVKQVKQHHSIYIEAPYCFEAGTPNVVGAVGLVAAIKYLESIGWDKIIQHEQELCSRLKDTLKNVEGLQIYGLDQQLPIFSFSINGLHPHDLAQVLDSENVAIRAGHHCAQPLHNRFNIPASCRVSLSFYNEIKDIDRLINGIQKAKEIFYG